MSRLPALRIGITKLKTRRLARLLNHFDTQKVFRCEASGYPTTPDGIPPESWRLAELADRTYQTKEAKSGETRVVT